MGANKKDTISVEQAKKTLEDSGMVVSLREAELILNFLIKLAEIIFSKGLPKK